MQLLTSKRYWVFAAALFLCCALLVFRTPTVERSRESQLLGLCAQRLEQLTLRATSTTGSLPDDAPLSDVELSAMLDRILPKMKPRGMDIVHHPCCG